MANWTNALPELEALAAARMREVNGGNPVTLERMYHGAVVQHWDPTSPTSLSFAVSCNTAISLTFPRCCITQRWFNEYGYGSSEDPIERMKNVAAHKKRCEDMQASFCGMPKGDAPLWDHENATFAFGGVHTLLEAPRGMDGSPNVYPVVYLMWLPSAGKKKSNDAELALLLNRAHAQATCKLGLHPGCYFVALYVASTDPCVKEDWKDFLPRGTIVIDAAAMIRVMEAFGGDAVRLFQNLALESDRARCSTKPCNTGEDSNEDEE